MGERAAIIGGGGREHALAMALSASDEVEEIYVLPGNAGTETMDKVKNVSIKASDLVGLTDFVVEERLNLVAIGPEDPLVRGLANRLQEHRIPVFGPTAEAARLEGSKAFATEFMKRYGIPHPLTTITHNYQEALLEVNVRRPGSYVIKADGLAGGKGVVLPANTREAEDVVGKMFTGDYDGEGQMVLIQERLHGPEVSAFVVSDGENFQVLPFAQDHKRLLDNDEGPNTGGMGAYAPVPSTIITADQERKIHDIAERSIQGMADEKTPFRGVLYIGLMLAKERDNDPVVIEYNVRFGDPEAQVLMALMQKSDVDVYDVLRSSAEGKLNKITKPIAGAALTICMAAPGYPGLPETGQSITGLKKKYEGVTIHHGATKRKGNKVLVNGGRILYLTGVGETVDEAAERAYAAVEGVHFDDEQHRTDIGWQARNL